MAARKIDLSGCCCFAMGLFARQASMWNAVRNWRAIRTSNLIHRRPSRRSRSSFAIRREFAAEPRPGISPRPLHLTCGSALHFCDFFDGHPGEHAEFDQLGRLWIDLPKFGQGRVQIDQLIIEWDFHSIAVLEFATLPLPSPTLAALATGIVDQNPAHGLGGGGEEMAAAVPGGFTRGLLITL